MAVSGISADSLLPHVSAFIGEIRRMLIGGELVEAADELTFFQSLDPATGEPITRVAQAGAEDVDRAVAAARRALGVWQGLAPAERGRLMNRLADLLQDNLEELAQLETLDNGKPIGHSRLADVPLRGRSLPVLRRLGDEDRGRHRHTPAYPDYDTSTLRREPIGVVGGSPLELPVGDGYLEGRAGTRRRLHVILKPAEQTPLTALRLGELAWRPVSPPVSSTSCPGGRGAGPPWSTTPRRQDRVHRVDRGRQAIVRGRRPHLKRVTLELGGKSPNIMFADADLDAASATALAANFFNSGQSVLGRVAVLYVAEVGLRQADRQRRRRGSPPSASGGRGL